MGGVHQSDAVEGLELLDVSDPGSEFDFASALPLRRRGGERACQHRQLARESSGCRVGIGFVLRSTGDLASAHPQGDLASAHSVKRTVHVKDDPGLARC